MPPPASHIEKPLMWWSRPGPPLPWAIGVRPNSPPQIDQRVVEHAALLQVVEQRRRSPGRSPPQQMFMSFTRSPWWSQSRW